MTADRGEHGVIGNADVVSLRSEVAALMRRVAAARRAESAASLHLAELYVEAKRSIETGVVVGSIEARLHASPQEAAEMDYTRLHTGFCRDITVTAADVERVK